MHGVATARVPTPMVPLHVFKSIHVLLAKSCLVAFHISVLLYLGEHSRLGIRQRRLVDWKLIRVERIWYSFVVSTLSSMNARIP
jgi:hypothetical protein